MPDSMRARMASLDPRFPSCSKTQMGSTAKNRLHEQWVAVFAPGVFALAKALDVEPVGPVQKNRAFQCLAESAEVVENKVQDIFGGTVVRIFKMA